MDISYDSDVDLDEIYAKHIGYKSYEELERQLDYDWNKILQDIKNTFKLE